MMGVIGFSFTEDKFIGFSALYAHKLDERAGRKGIMLGRYGKTLARCGMCDILILDERRLLNDLPRVAQKLHALLRQQDTPTVPQKDGRSRFFLQIAYGGRKARLRDKKRFGQLR